MGKGSNINIQIMGNFDTNSSLAIIVLAAFIHASFQASVSTLTLMSGHALGKKTAHGRLLWLIGNFVAGVGTMSLLLLSTLAFFLSKFFAFGTPLLFWAVTSGAVIGVGISVWLFYYRDPRGTSLWLPRHLAEYLGKRSKATKHTAEAYSLGLSSVISELLFVFAPILVTALVLIRLPYELQLIGIIVYTAISLLPLLIIGMLIGGGHTIAHIQRWRESNKRFLQFAAGGALLILGMYVYVERVVVTGVSAMGLR